MNCDHERQNFINLQDSCNEAMQTLQHLANIDTNTTILPQMGKDMQTMKNAIETISERGVKML